MAVHVIAQILVGAISDSHIQAIFSGLLVYRFVALCTEMGDVVSLKFEAKFVAQIYMHGLHSGCIRCKLFVHPVEPLVQPILKHFIVFLKASGIVPALLIFNSGFFDVVVPPIQGAVFFHRFFQRILFGQIQFPCFYRKIRILHDFGEPPSAVRSPGHCRGRTERCHRIGAIVKIPYRAEMNRRVDVFVHVRTSGTDLVAHHFRGQPEACQAVHIT